MYKKIKSFSTIVILLCLIFSLPAFAETVKYEYDGLHRLTSVERDKTLTIYEYDDLGNRTSMVVTLKYETPTALFSASPTSGVDPLTVSFTDQSTGDITSWSWNFGDGQTSTDQNHTHTYNTAGTYTVSLTATGPGGSDTKTIPDYILVQEDSDGDGLSDTLENTTCTDPFDADTDNDGISDGAEDVNKNGVVDPGETDPCNIDTDGDGIQDGTELGITDPIPDPDGNGPMLGTDTNIFIADADPTTTTDPLNKDSDDDGAWDGAEDANHNGLVDAGETDPNDILSNPSTLIHLKKGFNLIAIPADVTGQADLRDWLPAFGDSSEIEKVMAYDEANSRFVTLIPGGSSSPSFELQGGEGLIIYATGEKQVGFMSVDCSSLDLEQGFNLVGFSCPANGYSAYKLLNDLGSENVSSVQRYSVDKGGFETAGFGQDGQLAGVDFPIIPGEGYFLFMKQAVLDF